MENLIITVRSRCMFTLVLILLLASPGIATQWHVDSGNTSGPWQGSLANPFQIIQDGIDAASGGDTVLVQPGLYIENIDFLGKAITVKSSNGPRVTTIDGRKPPDPYAQSVVTFKNDERFNSVLDGFTITNGCGTHVMISNYYAGGGIFCLYSSPTIRNNIIVSNNAIDVGAGIYCRACGPKITNNIITKNSCMGTGGGIYSVRGGPVVTNNTICLNYAAQYGGGYTSYMDTAKITNSIFWGNQAPNQPEICTAFSGNPTVTYCNVEGGFWGQGNIYGDPLFVDAQDGDFHVRTGSPCIDKGNSNAPSLPASDNEGDLRLVDGDLNGIDRVDIGADELCPEIAARFGTVDAQNGSLSNVLFVNGSPGDNRRIYTILRGQAVEMIINLPPSGPNPAGVCLYEVWWEPGLSDLAQQPLAIGTSCIDMPLSKGSAAPPPLTIVNTIGHNWLLGNPIFQIAPPLPCALFSTTLLPQGTYTFQGYIQDNGSLCPFGVSLTNAVILKVQ